MATLSLEQWRQHIETAQAQGIPLAHYAKAHGLSRHALYSANKTLRKRARANPAPADLPAAATPFIAVQMAPPSTSWRAELPNGVVLHWPCADITDSLPLLQALAALPCSR